MNSAPGFTPLAAAEPGPLPRPGPSVAAAGDVRQETVVPFRADFGFPGVPRELRGLVEGLLLQIEGAVGSLIGPSSTPDDVRSFSSPQGAQGFVTVYPGSDRGKVDKVLVSWLLCPLPGGALLAFATVLVLMGPASAAPHLLLELTFSGKQASGEEGLAGEGGLHLGRAVAVMDLMLRKDPVVHPGYMLCVCEETGMNAVWEEAQKHPLLKQYSAPTPYIRASLSPTALSVTASLDPSPSSTAELLEALRPLAGKVAEAWAGCVANLLGEGLPENDAAEVQARDAGLARHGFEEDLRRSLPRLFGEERTSRVIEALRNP